MASIIGNNKFAEKKYQLKAKDKLGIIALTFNFIILMCILFGFGVPLNGYHLIAIIILSITNTVFLVFTIHDFARFKFDKRKEQIEIEASKSKGER